MTDRGEQVVITAVNTAPHNFGPASSRDESLPVNDLVEMLLLMVGPGQQQRLETAKVLPGWIEFIKNQNGVTNVTIILMGESEVEKKPIIMKNH